MAELTAAQLAAMANLAGTGKVVNPTNVPQNPPVLNLWTEVVTWIENVPDFVPSQGGSIPTSAVLTEDSEYLGFIDPESILSNKSKLVQTKFGEKTAKVVRLVVNLMDESGMWHNCKFSVSQAFIDAVKLKIGGLTPETPFNFTVRLFEKRKYLEFLSIG